MLISLTALAGSSHEKQLGCGIQTCVFRGTNSSNVFYFHISDYEPNLHSIGLPLKRLNLKTSWSWTSRAHCGSVICRDKFHRTRARFTRYFETTKLENQLKLGHLIVDRWLAETSFTVHALDSLDTLKLLNLKTSWSWDISLWIGDLPRQVSPYTRSIHWILFIHLSIEDCVSEWKFCFARCSQLIVGAAKRSVLCHKLISSTFHGNRNMRMFIFHKSTGVYFFGVVECKLCVHFLFVCLFVCYAIVSILTRERLNTSNLIIWTYNVIYICNC